MTDVAESLREAERWLDEIDGVEGVAQGKSGGEDCITVFISLPEAAERIPATLRGIRVVIERTDPFQVQV